MYLSTYSDEFAYFDLEINSGLLCSSTANMDLTTAGDAWGISCSGVAQVMEGNLLYSEMYYLSVVLH